MDGVEGDGAVQGDREQDQEGVGGDEGDAVDQPEGLEDQDEGAENRRPVSLAIKGRRRMRWQGFELVTMGS